MLKIKGYFVPFTIKSKKFSVMPATTTISTHDSLSNFLRNILKVLDKDSDSGNFKVVVRAITLKKEYTLFKENFGEDPDIEMRCYENLVNLKNSGGSFSNNLKDEMNGAIATIFDMDQILCSVESSDLSNQEKVLVGIKFLSKITGKKEQEIVRNLKQQGASLPCEEKRSEWYKLLYQKI